MKQTAIEWLESMLKNWDVLLPELKKAIIEQAKEMEKEQLRKAYLSDPYNNSYGFEQYYNEKFKSE